MSKSSALAAVQEQGFTLLTNHAFVLVLIARVRGIRMREIASQIGITERAVQRIIDDLTSHEYIVVTKDGRCNHYEIDLEKPLRHPLTKHRNIGHLVQFAEPQVQT